MAEEIIYDQIESGDPDDPLGLRKKLKQVQPKSDPLGLRSKLVESRADKVQQPAFQVQISEPTFKSTPTQTGIREFSYEKPVDELAAEKLKGKAAKAQSDLLVELKGNRDIKEKMIRQRRFDEYSGTVPISKSDMPKTSSTADVERIIIGDVKPQDLPVTEDDFIKEDIAIGNDRGKAVRLLEETMKQMPDKSKSIQKNVYLIDAFNSLSLTPEKANERAKKIEENAKRIGKDLIYDPRTNTLVRPLGIIGSAVEGWKQKSKLFSDYDFLKNTENDAAIAMDLEDRRTNIDPDEPVAIPKGKMSEISSMIGGTPIKPLIGGVVSSALTTPLGGAVAGSAIGGREFAKMEYAASFQQVYNELRDQGVEKFEAVRTARKQAEQAAEIGAISGAAMGAIGGRMGARPLAMSNAFKQSAFNVLKAAGDDLGKAGLEGLAAGGVGAAGQLYKNKLAQSAGINRELSEGVWQQIEGNLLTTVAMAAAIKSGRGITKPNYRNLLHGLSRLPDEQLGEMLNEKVNGGEITQKAADETLQRINEYKEKDAQIPANVTEEARFKIQDNIDKINELEAQKESTHKSLQGPIKERITKLEEDNIALSKEVDKPVKSESGLTKKQEKEATEFAEELIIEGVLPDTFEASVKSDPIGFWREIAQQAQNRDADWKPLGDQEAALSEQAVRDQFGDTVVDYAKELFPAPEKSIPESVSVIRPGEINQPEIITLKPKVDAETIRSDEGQVSEGGAEPRPSTGESGENIQQPEIERPITPETEQQAEKGTEEGTAPSQKGQVGEPKMVGITHAQMDELAQEFGLPTYEKSPEKVSEWDQQAARKLQEPDALNNLFNKLRNGELPDHVETRMMLQYMGDLTAKIERDPYNKGLQDQFIRTKDLFNIAGRLQGKGLAARKGSMPVEETLPDFIIRDREVNRAPLTDEQVTIAKKEYEALKHIKEKIDQKAAKDKEARVKQEAENVIANEVKKAKKQPKKDYSIERKDIVDNIKKKWDASKGQLSSTFIPYADRLVAIAPDVIKLMRSYVEQGITELPDVIKAIHKTVKDAVDGIEEKDIHDIIAGVYNEKKPSRNQLAQQLYDLRKEARLINELEQLENGIAPVSQKKQIIRNQKIEALKQQIKDLRDELGLNVKTDAEKLSALKARYKKQITDLEKKIADGNYSPDVKPAPIKLDSEATALKDEYIKLKAEREARLAQMEYEQMGAGKKALDLASQGLDTVRTLQTNPDLSFFGRQGIKYLVTHPIQGVKLFWESVLQAKSQKRYDRWLHDIHDSPAWRLIEDSGLAVLDPNTLHQAKREEEWRSQLIHKIPIAGSVAKASERAFTSAANMARVDWFMEGVNILEKQGKTWENSPEEYKAWASAVNNMTGRGGLGKFEPVVGQLAIPFWSPRLIAANVNLFLNPVYYAKMPKTARVMLIKNMAQYVGTGLAFLGLAKTLGADVETDWRSSDFGKIKVGNTRYDVWGGASQYIRVLAQVFKGQRKVGNQISELNTRSRVMTGANLVRTKLSPIIGFGVDVVLGENVVGEKVEISDAYKLMIPMLYNDIKDAAIDDKGGPGAATVAGLLSFLGIGAQTYGGKSGGSGSTNSKKKTVKQSKQKQTKTSK